MQKGKNLQFPCQKCKSNVQFSIFELDKNEGKVICPGCSLAYDFGDKDLMRQLTKFTSLCNQIRESEEILSNSSIGVYIGEKEVKIPFKVLLSRLNSHLELVMDDKPITITFRIEPTQLGK